MQLAVDPVSVGLVQRVSRPGGNVTGFVQWPQSLWGKRIELLTELLGRPPRRLAWMGNPRNASTPGGWAEARDAAARISSEIVRLDVNGAGDFDRAFEMVAKGRDALLVQFDFLFAVERRRLAALAVRHRLPAIYENRLQALGGITVERASRILDALGVHLRSVFETPPRPVAPPRSPDAGPT